MHVTCLNRLLQVAFSNATRFLPLCHNLGPCFQNNGRPMGADAASAMLECEDDDGTYELYQSNRTHRWCVFPNNGTEIPNSRVRRPRNANCDRFGKLVN